MLVKDYASVTGFVTSFTIVIAFSIAFSAPTRYGFVWVITTCIIIECSYPQTLTYTGKRAFIHWKWVYGLPCTLANYRSNLLRPDNCFYISVMYIYVLDYLSRGGELVMQFNERYPRYMPFLFYYAFTAKYEHIRYITESIKDFYFGNNNIGFMTAFQLRDVSNFGKFCIWPGIEIINHRFDFKKMLVHCCTYQFLIDYNR